MHDDYRKLIHDYCAEGGKDVQLDAEEKYSFAVGDAVVALAVDESGGTLLAYCYVTDLPAIPEEREKAALELLGSNGHSRAPAQCLVYDPDFEGIILMASAPVEGMDGTGFSAMVEGVAASALETRENIASKFHISQN